MSQVIDYKSLDETGGVYGPIIASVESEFPFGDYMSRRYDVYENIAGHVEKSLPKGAKILDFGSGPCDKTAVLTKLGYECHAYDDLEDEWHKVDNNREKIMAFAKKAGVHFTLADRAKGIPYEKQSFDMVMLHGVIEHFHSSPKDLLNQIIGLLKDDGLLYITVPSAVNIRKRISVLLGKTNLPPFQTFYWYPGDWRGHVREYTKGDLKQLCKNLGLKNQKICGCHHMLNNLGQGRKGIKRLYKFFMTFFPNMKDTWTFIGKRPQNWEPLLSLPREEVDQLFKKATVYRSNQEAA